VSEQPEFEDFNERDDRELYEILGCGPPDTRTPGYDADGYGELAEILGYEPSDSRVGGCDEDGYDYYRRSFSTSTPLLTPKLRRLRDRIACTPGGVGARTPALLNCAPYALGFRCLHSDTWNESKGSGFTVKSRAPLHLRQRTYIASPLIPFRISGLLVWGATKDTLITNCQVRLTQQIRASAEPIPALLFASGLSFAELCARMKERDGTPVRFRPRPGEALEPSDFIEGWLDEHPEVRPHQLFDLNTLSTGDQVRIEIVGPLHQLVFWGLGLRD
jgi:hypothetical protein